MLQPHTSRICLKVRYMQISPGERCKKKNAFHAVAKFMQPFYANFGCRERIQLIHADF